MKKKRYPKDITEKGKPIYDKMINFLENWVIYSWNKECTDPIKELKELGFVKPEIDPRIKEDLSKSEILNAGGDLAFPLFDWKKLAKFGILQKQFQR